MRLALVGGLAVFACAGFAGVGAGTLAALHGLTGVPSESDLVLKLAVKSVLFVLTAVLCLLAVRHWLPRTLEDKPGASPEEEATWRTRLALFGALGLAAALAFPRLGAWPSLQPDETHHLIVARNLAVYGKYASGSPDKGFIYRDPYDSVGPPVLGPVAMAFGLTGNSLPAARSVMACYYLALCAALYFLFKPVFGPAGAVSGLFMLQGAFGSVYLARTLYGEVPALFYLVMALVLWRRAIGRPGFSWEGFLAGGCFAFMIFCKAFLFISLWAITAAWLYDRLAHRIIRWRHVVWPAVGALLTGSVVTLTLSFFPSPSQSTIAQIVGYYEHYLMFGFKSVPVTLAWVCSRPIETLGAIAAMAAAVPVLFHRRYDPAAAALFFLAPLLAFWWIFFTPGNIPRYTFYSSTIGALFAGALVWNALRQARDSERSILWRCAAGGVALLLAVAAEERCRPEMRGVYFVDEARDDRELAAYVAALPRDTSVATTHWPLEKMMTLLADRYVPLISSVTPPPDAYSVVIAFPQTDALSDRPALRDQRTPDLTIGRYAIVLNPQ
ncbi:MAG: glycosyltransferase family 39 protein [Candidatus Hydrogenedentes bacterium]|nr:glycosyltransferase family 39 protein [Candidatus Hydrogenedentota bacterium]